jgi:glutaredoxin-related protein
VFDGGFDSYIIAQEFDCSISIPTMGRKKEGEEQMPGLTHLPYMDWVDWIKTLNNFKYGIHLMRTHAAGTFALNCAYLGIPCIAYDNVNTQKYLHPDLSVPDGDIKQARKLATRLANDNDFYTECSNAAKNNFSNLYSEDKFIEYF